jgi:hypothetical protein
VFLFTTGGLDKAEEKSGSCMGPPMYYSALGIPKNLELPGNLEQILAERVAVKIGMIIRRATLVVAGRSSYDAMPRSATP